MLGRGFADVLGCANSVAVGKVSIEGDGAAVETGLAETTVAGETSSTPLVAGTSLHAIKTVPRATAAEHRTMDEIRAMVPVGT